MIGRLRRLDLIHHRDAIRIAEGQSSEQRAVDDAEHGRRQSDPKRERDDAGNRDARAAHERSHGVRHVAAETTGRFEPHAEPSNAREAASLAGRDMVERLITKLGEQLLARGTRVDARAQFGMLLLEMLRDFIDDLRFCLGRERHAGETRADVGSPVVWPRFTHSALPSYRRRG